MIRILTVLFALFSTSAWAEDFSPRQTSDTYQVAQNVCGFYVILGCGKNRSAIRAERDRWGGPNAGGGAGLRVANTNEYPNFRNGFYCLVDGPYRTADQARSIAWSEAVPDAYVKSGC